MARRFGGTVSHGHTESVLLFRAWDGNREGDMRERKKYLDHFTS
jgi:hypothetical protein